MSEPVFFWGCGEFACFSNFYPSLLNIVGRDWPTVEHFFQAMKTIDFDQQEFVRAAATPGEAKKRGRKVTMLPDWDQIKYNVMLEALRLKFSLEPYRSILLSTGDRPIYEDSPYDRIWGTGVLRGIGTGQNLLGKALMEVRAERQGGRVP